MARPLRIAYPGAIYHVINRGHRRDRIFTCDDDRREFLRRLLLAVRKYRLILHGWCLMPNHFHLLLETPDANLSRAMHTFQSSYANWFRIKYRLVGSVFQGRYKAVLIENTEYLLTLLCYINLNPVRAKIVERPEKFPWSSHRIYLGAATDEMTTTARVLAEAGGVENLLDIMRDQEIEPEQVYGKYSIVGGEEFYYEMKEKLDTGKLPDRQAVPDVRGLTAVKPEAIAKAVCAVTGTTEDELHQKRSRSVARKLYFHLLKHDTALMAKEIAVMAGMSAVGFSSLMSQFECLLLDDKRLRKLCGDIRKKYHVKL
jgi:REP element-mobilizing transposase RayT